MWRLSDGRPPCSECDKARDWECGLWAVNETPFRIWKHCDIWGRDAWTGKLRIDAVTSYAGFLGADAEDVEKVLNLEMDVWDQIKPKETK